MDEKSSVVLICIWRGLILGSGCIIMVNSVLKRSSDEYE